MTHTDVIGRLKDRYEPKINLLLQNIAEELRECGFTTDGPFPDTSSGDYQWVLFWDDMGIPGGTVELTIMESIREGRLRVNFKLDVISAEGDEIMRVMPYKFTKRPWADARDEAAVLDRWEVFERSVCEDVVNEIQEFQAMGA